MNVIETKLKGCYILEPNVYKDDRGYFFESYNENRLTEILGYSPNFVQDNESKSTYGVIRGLHMQAGEHAQAKLVRVLDGKVIDVVVDVRPNSKTFGEHIAIELTAENKLQLFIPRGFLHGFSVISDKAVFFYKCDNFYNKESERGALYNSPELNIDWGIPLGKEIISVKDIELPCFNAMVNP